MSSFGHIIINYNIISYFEARTSRMFQVNSHNRYGGMIHGAHVNTLHCGMIRGGYVNTLQWVAYLISKINV
jgi:hypothetical protein